MARILIVDDDDAIRRVLRKMLERHGHEVLDVPAADSALEMLGGERPPDAIVCDVMMPGMDGLAFYRELQQRAPELASCLVFLTGVNQVPSVHQAIEQLGAPLLGKLDDLQLVLDAVQLVLLRRPGP